MQYSLMCACILLAVASSGIPAAERGAVQITNDAGYHTNPHWSPGGASIAYDSDHSGNADIWLIPAVGGSPTRLTTSPYQDFAPAW